MTTGSDEQRSDPLNGRERPPVYSAGKGDNIYQIAGAAFGALRKAYPNDGAELAKAMMVRVQQAKSYDEACGIIEEYVELT